MPPFGLSCVQKLCPFVMLLWCSCGSGLDGQVVQKMHILETQAAEALSGGVPRGSSCLYRRKCSARDSSDRQWHQSECHIFCPAYCQARHVYCCIKGLIYCL